MITVILKDKSSQEVCRTSRDRNEKYLIALDNNVYPLLSELDENAYDVFSSEQARKLYEELIDLKSKVDDEENKNHIEEISKLAFRAANEPGATLTFTPFL